MREMTFETFYIINQIPKINRTPWNLPWMSCFLKYRSLKISLETLERSVSTAKRRQKLAAKHHGIYEIPPFGRCYLVLSLNECWLHTCDACVITTWRLGLPRLLLSPQLQYKTLVRTAVGLKFVIECSKFNKIEMVVWVVVINNKIGLISFPYCQAT